MDNRINEIRKRIRALSRSLHRQNAQPADPIRIFKNWRFRYWTQTLLG